MSNLSYSICSMAGNHWKREAAVKSVTVLKRHKHSLANKAHSGFVAFFSNMAFSAVGGN